MQKIITKSLCLFFGVFFIFLILNNPLSAQNKFAKATIQWSDGTLQEGLIQDNDLSIFSRLIAFKNHKKAKELQVFHPGEIAGFTTANNQNFKSLAVDFQIVTKGGMVYDYENTRFVRVLQEGKISVYELRDFDVRAYFIQKEGQPAELLSFNRKLAASEVSKFTSLLTDCGCIQYDETLPTRINDVILTAQEYNEFVAAPLNGATAVYNKEAKVADTEMEMP